MRFDSLAESERFPIVPWLLFWDREMPPGLEGKHWVHQRSVLGQGSGRESRALASLDQMTNELPPPPSTRSFQL